MLGGNDASSLRLVPGAVFEEVGEAELRLHPLPRPTEAEAEVEASPSPSPAVSYACCTREPSSRRRPPDGALDVLQLEGIQVPRSGSRPPARRPGRRSAFVEGLSLHADTWLHKNDVTGLERLCN